MPHMPWDRAAYLAPISTGGGAPADGGGEAADFGLGSRSAHVRAAADGSGGRGGSGAAAAGGAAAGGGGAAARGGGRLRFGVLRDDGWFGAAPALARALEETVQAARGRVRRRRPSPS